MTTRYAVYFIPRANSHLADFGARWLGWDVHRAKQLPLRPIGEIADRLHRDSVEAPSRYGFHATLKAPMKLTPDTTRQQFLDAVSSFASRRPSIIGATLELSRLGRFLALTLSKASLPVSDLADCCVRELDRFRAPSSSVDRNRRRPESLTFRQRALLDRWGYPFVLDEYRFHMTLTGPLDSVTSAKLMQALTSELAPIIEQPLSIDAITIVIQDQADAPFRLLKRFPLRSPC